MTVPEVETMAPVSVSIEDACLCAQRVRIRCMTRLDSERYTADVARCFVQLNKLLKAVMVFSEINTTENIQNGTCDFTEVLEQLDSIAIPNPITYKKLLAGIPLLSEAVETVDYFRIRRICYTSKWTTVKPVFSFDEVTIVSREYVYCHIATKTVLLLLELAQLEHWALRFYNGLGYSRMALLLTSLLLKNYAPLYPSTAALHHITCHAVLTALCILKTEEHHDCGCNAQMVEVTRTFSFIMTYLLIVDPTRQAGQEFVNQCTQKPASLERIFVDVNSIPNAYNKQNPATSLPIGIFAFYMEFKKNGYLKGDNGLNNIRALEKTVTGDCMELAVACFVPLKYPYLTAAVQYTTGCNYSLLSAECDDADTRGWERKALHSFTECVSTLKGIDSKKVRESHLALYGCARVAITLMMFRNIVTTMTTLSPQEQVSHFYTLRDQRRETLPRDKLLGEQTKEKLIAAVSLLTVYLGNYSRKLMSFKNGKYKKKLITNLAEARETAETLLLREPNLVFCRFMFSDLGELWNVPDESTVKNHLKEKALVLLLGMKTLGQAAQRGKEQLEAEKSVEAGAGDVHKENADGSGDVDGKKKDAEDDDDKKSPGDPEDDKKSPGDPDDDKKSPGDPDDDKKSPGDPDDDEKSPGDPDDDKKSPGDPDDDKKRPGDRDDDKKSPGDPDDDRKSPGDQKSPGDPDDDKKSPGDPDDDTKSPGDPDDDKMSPGDPDDDKKSPGDPDDDNKSPGDPDDDKKNPGDPDDDKKSPGDPNDDKKSPGDPDDDKKSPGDPDDDKKSPGDPVVATGAANSLATDSGRFDDHTDEYFLDRSEDQTAVLDHLAKVHFMYHIKKNVEEAIYSKGTSHSGTLKDKTMSHLKELYWEALMKNGVPEPATAANTNADQNDLPEILRKFLDTNNLKEALRILRDFDHERGQMLDCFAQVVDAIGLQSYYDQSDNL